MKQISKHAIPMVKHFGAVTAALFCASCGPSEEERPVTPSTMPANTTSTQQHSAATDIYNQLRSSALAHRPDPSGPRLEPSVDAHGIVIDWNMGEDKIITVVFMQDGSASMYLINGGGVIGAGEHEAVRLAGVRVLQEAFRVHEQFTKSANFDLPADQQMRFTLVASDGLYTNLSKVSSLMDKSYELYDLGNRVQRLIYEIRTAKRD